MADPKIRFDIEAATSGDADVNRLATSLERLDGAIDPSLAENAKELAAELRAIGQQQEAISTFVGLKEQARSASEALQAAQQQAQAYAREINTAGEPTKTQTGRLEKLRDAVRAAKDQEQLATQALQDQRKALNDAGIGSDELASKTRELSRRQEEAVQGVRQLQAAQDAAGQAAQRQAAEQVAAQAEVAAAAQRAAAAEAAAEQRRSAVSAAVAASNEKAVASAKRAAAARVEAANQAMAAERRQQQAAEAAALADELREQELIARSRQIAAQYSRLATAATEAGQKQTQVAAGVRTGLEGIGDQLRTVQQIASAAIGGQLLGGLIGQLSQTADQYNNLAARIKLTTGEGAAFDQAFQGVFDVATRTNSAVEETGTLFAKLAAAGKAIGVSNQEALALTETINQATQLSGASAESSRAAIQQLIQGLQSGVLRGDEFNSVMEQAPRLAQALSDGLGVTTGELRKLAEAGSLTSQVVIQSLRGQASAVQAEFEQLPASVGRALQNLSTQWTQYVGEVDQANGVTTKAAGLINLIAGNLDTLGAILLNAGKAWAAYKALDLARFFLDKASAIQRASAALAADTEVTIANTAAKRANSAASATAAAGLTGIGASANAAGGFIRGFVTKASQIAGIGTAIGAVALAADLLVDGIHAGQRALVDLFETMDGSKKRAEESAIAQKADAESARLAAAEKAALAQKTQQAADAALGLNAASKLLVAEFDAVITKGDGVAAAMEKVSKSLQLDNLQGIKDAITALDALEQKGKITGDQVRDSLAAALNGKDLLVFQTTAQAAFDGTEQGARRLADAINAVTVESLRRAGTSLEELTSGFSTGANKALNDVDTLAASLERLGAKGEIVSRTLGASLDQALQAAGTSKAVQAVIDRYQELGQQGLITGDQLAQGLEKARNKLDDLVPGVNTVSEAFRALGLKAPEELDRIADSAKKAFDVIQYDGTVALSQKQEAFRRYAEAAIASNDRIKIAEASIVAGVYDMELATDRAGKTVVRVAGEGAEGFRGWATAANSAAGAVDAVTAALEAQNAAQERLNAAKEKAIELENKRQNVDANGFALDMTGKNTINAEGQTLTSLIAQLKALGLDDSAAQSVARQFADSNGNVPSSNNPGQAKYGGSSLSDALAKAAQQALYGKDGSGAKQTPSSTGATATASGSTSHTVTIKLGSTSTTINTASAADANALTSFLAQLEEEAARAA